MPFRTILGTWWEFSVLRILVEMTPKPAWSHMAVVESITKTLEGVSALLDQFRDMVGVFRFYALW